MFDKNKKESIEAAVEAAVRRVAGEVVGETRQRLAGIGEALSLREQIETLKIEKARKEEEFARREREVEHKVGLERKRQEFEVAQAKRETTVTVREENLSADKKRFEEQMAFHSKRFEAEVGYLKDMLGKVLARLPSAEIAVSLSNQKAGGSED